MTVTLQRHPAGPLLLVLSGDLDHHTTPRLRAALDELSFGPGPGLVIDLSAMKFCDSTGIAALVAAHQRAQDAGTVLVLAGLDPDIARIFYIMGLDRLFSFYDTVEKAVGSLSS
ncbi:STAS domain-containing protein [Sphaerisporangium sp. NPDC088356]|uniref:STAS domain-containing protein n=1 Tax=Sphaerisporangium sp. NPDC088356 TaxID=3154871 RepID=UPI00341CC22C